MPSSRRAAVCCVWTGLANRLGVLYHDAACPLDRLSPFQPTPNHQTTIKTDRLGIQKTTGRLDNTDTPKWDAMLDFGCVEENSRLSFRYVFFCCGLCGFAARQVGGRGHLADHFYVPPLPIPTSTGSRIGITSGTFCEARGHWESIRNGLLTFKNVPLNSAQPKSIGMDAWINQSVNQPATQPPTPQSPQP